MSTTVDLDPRLELRLRALARRRGETLEELVLELVGLGLGALPESGEPYRLTTFASDLRPGIDPESLNRLADVVDL